jgi:hypothetical protein
MIEPQNIIKHYKLWERNIKTLPYTYLIGWPKQNLWYYGVRYAEGCHPSDLWNPYKTSSIHVKDTIKKYGTPSLRVIRKLFSDSDTARLWEHRVLKKLKVIKDPKWINKTDNKSISPMYGADNPASRIAVKSKISESLKKWYLNNSNPRLGKTTSQEVKEKQSRAKLKDLNPFYGKKHTFENLKSYSENQKGSNNSFFGKKHSNETIQKMKEDRQGVAKPKIQCPHCSKIGGINTMPRWHFNKCKELKNVG